MGVGNAEVDVNSLEFWAFKRRAMGFKEEMMPGCRWCSEFHGMSLCLKVEAARESDSVMMCVDSGGGGAS